MTARELYDQALRLLNYTNSHGELGNGNYESQRRGLALVNQIYADIYRIENGHIPNNLLLTMQETPALSREATYDVMPYGIAMLIAQSESDSDNQSLFASLYNQKRSSTPRRQVSRIDTLPRPYW